MNRVAIESAVKHFTSSRIILWCSDPLDGNRHFEEIKNLENVSVRQLTADTLFDFVDTSKCTFDVSLLKEIYQTIESHITRSNIARAAALYFEGGVYLDIDTLVIRDFAPLLKYPGFLGTEHVLWPYTAIKRYDLYRFLWGPALGWLRKFSGLMPGGIYLYYLTNRLYSTAVNGAIMGFEKGHPFLAKLLTHSTEVPRSEWQLKHRLGTHALQQVVSEYKRNDLKIFDTSHFYPLGPVVSRQYFRPQYNLKKTMARIIRPSTYAIHWYASVSELMRINPDDLRCMTSKTVFGYLCSPFLKNI